MILLSPTQIGTLFRCQYQWYLRYVEGLKVPPKPAMIQGSSFHKGYEINFTSKIETGEDLPLEHIEDVTADTFDSLSIEVEDWDVDKGKVKDMVIQLADVYYPTAKQVNPIAVEDYMEFEGDGFTIRGYADIITSEMKVIDLKTANKKPTKQDEIYKLQLETYALNGDLKSAELHYAVKSSKSQVVIQEYDLPEDNHRVLDIAKTAAGIIQAGVFAPTGLAHSWACSFCGYKTMGLCPYNR